MKLQFLAVALVAFSTHGFAGTDSKDIASITPPPCEQKDWSVEIGLGMMWSNVRTDEPA